MIRRGKVRIFAPFVNAKYTNTCSRALIGRMESGALGQDVHAYYDAKVAQGHRPENVIPNVNKWWANGNIICNKHCPIGEVSLRRTSLD